MIICVEYNDVGKAKGLLDTHQNSNKVDLWIVVVVNNAREKHGINALGCSEQMQCEGIFPYK